MTERAAPGDPPSAAPLPTTLAFLLVAAGRTAQRRIDETLATRGLSLRHVGALGHLARRPDASYSDLARRAGVTPQSMRATVLRLEELGAVDRATAGQGHPVVLEVTDAGRELLDWAGTVVARLDDQLLGDLPDEQRDRLRATLRGVAMPGGFPDPP
ncbi:MAG: MarR family winged helix-turn-helix transcriptional regulator [Actinomycetota bacterium]|nr:MarR family winged helix-turn-helix transcriptional regulator [Actinomycetota bacterium]